MAPPEVEPSSAQAEVGASSPKGKVDASSANVEPGEGLLESLKMLLQMSGRVSREVGQCGTLEAVIETTSLAA